MPKQHSTNLKNNNEYGLYSEEMLHWEHCHGERLTAGAYVKITPDSDRYKRLKNDTFMVVAIIINKNGDVEISLNNGTLTNTAVSFDGFAINELTTAELTTAE